MHNTHLLTIILHGSYEVTDRGAQALKHVLPLTSVCKINLVETGVSRYHETPYHRNIYAHCMGN